MKNKSALAGILLKMERLRQNKGQKEVCYGICVPSYLSKIEHGAVCPDEKILAELFRRLGVPYEEDEKILTEYGERIEAYFYCLHYHLETKQIYEELKAQEKKLSCSRFAIDWLLIRAFEKEEVMSLLEALEENMEAKQQAYYKILCSLQGRGIEEGVRLCREACEVLNNSYAMLWLCNAYMMQGNYSSIHAMEQRLVTAAVAEGNTYALAECFFINGSAYACLNMEEMMMLYYERGIRLLQNTGWQKELTDFYYNIGATYISLKKYDLALKYLEKAEEQNPAEVQEDVWGIHILHKKAIALIRSGRKEEAKEFLANMKKHLLSMEKPLEADWLKYEEAVMECETDFLEDPEYLELLEKLIKAIKKELHFGHLYFYRDVIVEAYQRQRKYKKALEFEKGISSNITK